MMLGLASQACSDPSSAPSRVPAVGTYAYSGSTQAGPASPARSYTGKITISYANAGYLEAQWDVEGFAKIDRRGFWINIYGAYTLDADPVDFAVVDIRHRISRSSTGLDCTGDIVGFINFNEVTQPLICSMVLLSR